MDKDFFRRVLKFGIAILIIIFLNSDYAKLLFFNYEDLIEFDLNIKQILYAFITIMVISSIAVFRISREPDIVIKIIKSFSYSVFVAMVLTLLVDALDNSFVFHVNRIYTKKTNVISYRVGPIKDEDGFKTVTLKRNDGKNGFKVFNKFSPEDINALKNRRGFIYLETHIGLFDRPFLPNGKLEPR